MSEKLAIKEITAVVETLDDLSDILVRIVEDGASIGFLTPFSKLDAEQYWQAVPGKDVILLIAVDRSKVVGTVQLHLASKPNGLHRAEVAKLLTHPDFQRKGIGRALMLKAEEMAKKQGRTLLVLDTRKGDPSNLLYTSLGYQLTGEIPLFAKSSIDGSLESTMVYYKNLE
ncbi:GNAT family N-acetyltransferase [Jeotgalibacillus proteolyticus]|uniref:GNAT family N-acetyltransferase n=1 Tax=Jeotgalibacillus proteolyticus TaxID=2082395 RepID=A0A2S5GBH6_9BACL|nr:GNAT family N-acetyltransferase [Jeotgalibacillus proteolyticus]PPA70349.1 GNAT family N-acetyltransferase [Jeotgalibacillus proteolyticus]